MFTIPQFHHFYRWYVYHSRMVVYGLYGILYICIYIWIIYGLFLYMEYIWIIYGLFLYVEYIWLVVYLPHDDIPNRWKVIKFMFQTTNQICM